MREQGDYGPSEGCAPLRQPWEGDDESGLPPKDIRRLRTILLGLVWSGLMGYTSSQSDRSHFQDATEGLRTGGSGQASHSGLAPRARRDRDSRSHPSLRHSSNARGRSNGRRAAAARRGIHRLRGYLDGYWATRRSSPEGRVSLRGQRCVRHRLTRLSLDRHAQAHTQAHAQPAPPGSRGPGSRLYRGHPVLGDERADRTRPRRDRLCARWRGSPDRQRGHRAGGCRDLQRGLLTADAVDLQPRPKAAASRRCHRLGGGGFGGDVPVSDYGRGSRRGGLIRRWQPVAIILRPLQTQVSLSSDRHLTKH